VGGDPNEAKMTPKISKRGKKTPVELRGVTNSITVFVEYNAYFRTYIANVFRGFITGRAAGNDGERRRSRVIQYRTVVVVLYNRQAT